MSVPREGGCACGEVRYRLKSEALFTHCCHCLNCQRQTGSAFVTNLLIEADRVELLRQCLELVNVLQHIITFVHHGREETLTKKELVGQTLLLEVSFQS